MEYIHKEGEGAGRGEAVVISGGETMHDPTEAHILTLFIDFLEIKR